MCAEGPVVVHEQEEGILAHVTHFLVVLAYDRTDTTLGPGTKERLDGAIRRARDLRGQRHCAMMVLGAGTRPNACESEEPFAKLMGDHCTQKKFSTLIPEVLGYGTHDELLACIGAIRLYATDEMLDDYVVEICSSPGHLLRCRAILWWHDRAWYRTMRKEGRLIFRAVGNPLTLSERLKQLLAIAALPLGMTKLHGGGI